jgi:hypothetical protein
MEAVNFAFDTNAYSCLCDRNDFDAIVALIKDQRGTVRPLFSVGNWFEYLKGMTESNFTKRQSYLKSIHRLVLEGAVLADTKSHIRHALGMVTDADLIGQVSEMLANIRLLIHARDFHAFWTEVGEAIRHDVERNSAICSGYSDMIKVIVDRAEITKSAIGEKWLSALLQGDKTADGFRNMVNGGLKRFDLNLSFFGGDPKVLFQRLPSVEYFFDVYLHFVRRGVHNKRKVKSGDYVDMDQVFYLNVADYLVTRDKALRSLVNECGNDALKSRAISPEEFIDLLHKPIIVPRAPEAFAVLCVPKAD